MSQIFNKLIPLSQQIITKFENVAGPINEKGINDYDWSNKVFFSFNKFRRGHVEVLDKRDKNMWIMHITVFPHVDDNSPIFGFDIVSTANKISGVFCDFSITTNPEHEMVKWFENKVKDLKWKKERELPDWGKAIFSKNMIAAGAINTDEELNQVINTCIECLNYYLFKVGDTIYGEFVNEITSAQNRYCKYQKQNPYPVKMLTNFGLTKDKAENFVNNHLFPELHSH
jgi:hypothetical protein